MRRVPQEAFLSTARIFRTVGGPLRYRMLQTVKMRKGITGLGPAAQQAALCYSRYLSAVDAADPSGWVVVAACHRMSPYTRKAPYIAVKCFLERKTGLGPAAQQAALCYSRYLPAVETADPSGMGCGRGLSQGIHIREKHLTSL